LIQKQRFINIFFGYRIFVQKLGFGDQIDLLTKNKTSENQQKSIIAIIYSD